MALRRPCCAPASEIAGWCARSSGARRLSGRQLQDVVADDRQQAAHPFRDEDCVVVTVQLASPALDAVLLVAQHRDLASHLDDTVRADIRAGAAARAGVRVDSDHPQTPKLTKATKLAA